MRFWKQIRKIFPFFLIRVRPGDWYYGDCSRYYEAPGINSGQKSYLITIQRVTLFKIHGLSYKYFDEKVVGKHFIISSFTLKDEIYHRFLLKAYPDNEASPLNGKVFVQGY